MQEPIKPVNANGSTNEQKLILDNLQRMAKIGWWEVDFNRQICMLSEFIVQNLQTGSNQISFEQLASSIHPDYRSQGIDTLLSFPEQGSYDVAFPVHTKFGYLWVHAKLVERELTPEGHCVARGYIQSMAEEEFLSDSPQEEISKNQLRELLKRQRNLSQSLLQLLKTSDTDSIIEQTLKDILTQFNGDRSYIFEYNWEKQTHSCTYEITREGINPEIDSLQNMDLNAARWWARQTCNYIPIVINDMDELPEEASEEKEVLLRQGIESLMVMPMPAKNGVRGYIGIDIVGKKKKWSNVDKEWFTSLANIISICIELKRSEAALKNSQETLQNIYKNIPVGIEIYDKEGYLLDINDCEAEIFGFKKKEDVLGVNLFENPNIPQKEKEKLKRGEDIDCDFIYTFANVSKGYYQTKYDGDLNIKLRGTILYNANKEVENYLLIVIDNTQTLKTYKKLQEFEKLFTSIAQFGEIGISQWNPTTKQFFGSRQWFNNLNQKERNIEHVFDAYSQVHPEDLKELMQFFEEVDRNKKESFQKDIRIKDGEAWKWLRYTLRAKECHPETNHVEIVGLNINVTELKQTETRLIEAKIKAEESDKLKSAFLANMSHEIRTPLNAIVGFSNLLGDTSDPKEKEQFMSIIQKNNELLLQLISDILDLSKIEAGMFEVTNSNIDVNNLCKEIVCSHQLKCKEGVKLTFEKHLPQCTLFCDRNRLAQVLSNFITNAQKFTQSGSIKLGYTIQNKEIKFYVQDTGIGIATNELENVFNRFVKLNTFVHGTGLGLSICKSIADKLGGCIGAESELNVGTRFWFSLPWTDNTIPNTSNKKQTIEKKESTMGKDKITILIAEDTDSNYILLFTILKKEYNIIRAINGKEAVRLHQEADPDLILMDMKMPEMDGLTATRMIRETDQETPIIALTAFAFDSDKQKAFEAGCTEYMSKPIIPTVLKERIKEIIGT